ncbi:hypothetical protein BDZ94DRAFT_1269501 [Collybia nuda]|uniref:N-acetyltransferase domain-containing protein n=1 Tax=Collybia nuda TaxID=64659 RepID=A0A9P5XYJ8_9AGAR|nr:hypothetical protein BDZ94DRAFT_1269501 [Collybia nuda]
MTSLNIRRIEDVNDELLDKAAELFYILMKDDLAGASLTGGDSSLIQPLARSLIRACALEGEFYVATGTESGELVGYAAWMPTGHELLESEAQRELGYDDFAGRLSEAGNTFFKDTYLKRFPGFVNQCLGPTGRRDAWWLHQLMVRTEYQRQGVARSLINVVKTKAAKNHQRLALSVTKDSNIPVYTNQGFIIRGRSELKSPWGDYPLIILSYDT